MDRIIRNQPLYVWGDGETIRDYIHIDDVVSGLLAIAQASRSAAASWIFNLGSGRGLSINALISHLKTISDAKLDVRYDTARKFDVPTSVLDISRARIELDWHPEIDFHTGLRRTFELALAQHYSASHPSSRVTI